MSKKLFKRLIKKASQPVPKEQDKQLSPDGYSGKRTRFYINTSVKVLAIGSAIIE